MAGEKIEGFYAGFFPEKTPYERYRSSVTGQKIFDAICRRKGRLLDLGCGNGELLKELRARNEKNLEFFGADISASNLEKIPSGNVVKADLEFELPFKSNSFDVVVLREVIEHLLNRRQVVEEIHRVLKTGGAVVVTCPHKYSLVLPGYLVKNSLLHRMQPIENWLSKRELRELLAGKFSEVDLRSYNFFPYHSVLPKALIPLIKRVEGRVQNTPVDRKLIAVGVKG